MPSIACACRDVMLTADPLAKVMAARAAARNWHLGRLDPLFDVAMPDRPARPSTPELLPPNRMPRRGKAGSLRTRVAMLHALAHIEFVAIDLAIDCAGRFGGQFERSFVNDWIAVAADEAMHFALLSRRLRQLGSHYGALPAHNGLWEAAEDTAHDVMARLAIVPMVLEARALDVTPAMIERFTGGGDTASARILDRIMNDEIRHVGAGTRWFKLAANRAARDPVEEHKSLLSRHFRGALRPPFNDSARHRAGLTREYYAALAW
jgi:uncharacterized ferritin-like protein (DUF455 family)